MADDTFLSSCTCISANPCTYMYIMLLYVSTCVWPLHLNEIHRNVWYIFLKMRIVDDEGSIVEIGKEGKVEVKSLYMFYDYKDLPQTTRESLTSDGFFKTRYS